MCLWSCPEYWWLSCLCLCVQNMREMLCFYSHTRIRGNKTCNARILIDRSRGALNYYISDKMKFPNIHQLLSYYREHRIHCKDGIENLRLLFPLRKVCGCMWHALFPCQVFRVSYLLIEHKVQVGNLPGEWSILTGWWKIVPLSECAGRCISEGGNEGHTWKLVASPSWYTLQYCWSKQASWELAP